MLHREGSVHKIDLLEVIREEVVHILVAAVDNGFYALLHEHVLRQWFHVLGSNSSQELRALVKARTHSRHPICMRSSTHADSHKHNYTQSKPYLLHCDIRGPQIQIRQHSDEAADRNLRLGGRHGVFVCQNQVKRGMFKSLEQNIIRWKWVLRPWDPFRRKAVRERGCMSLCCAQRTP